MENIELVYSLFNQYLFQQAKNNIIDIQYYFDTSASTCGNRLIGELINAIKTFSLEQLDIPLFNSIMARCGKTPAESSKIINDIIKWKSYNKKQMEPAKKFLEDIVANSIIQKANKLYQEHPSEFLKYLKNTEFKTSTLDTLSSTKFNQIDINTIVADTYSEGVTSSMDFINQAFQPNYKYEMGQIVIICAAPGVGKSIFCMQEALHMATSGKKVNYLALGDLSYSDFVIRMCAQYSGLPFWDAKKNIKSIYEGLSRVIGNNLDIIIEPAGTLTVDDYVDYVIDKDYDVLFVDYDSNFKSSNTGDNMYLAYGDIYEKLTRLSIAGKLVFVCSQPVRSAWYNEVIDLPEIGESSRKQHTADVIITRGRVTGNQNHLGTFKIAKNRRGEVGVEIGSIRLDNGRFLTLPTGVYEMLKNIKEKKNYTEADIQSMIRTYDINKAQIQSQINGSYKNNPNPSPKKSDTVYTMKNINGPKPF